MLDLIHAFRFLVQQDATFWFCALAGSGLFFIQFLLTLFGADSQEEFHDISGAAESGQFRWLTKQAATGFLMMFGWVGLTCKHQFALPLTVSALIAVAAGLVSLLITSFIFNMARKLRSSGTVFSIEDAIGKEGVIYQRIPKGGIGKISVSLQGFTHEIDAVSDLDYDLPSFSNVHIIKKADENTVVVVPLKP